MLEFVIAFVAALIAALLAMAGASLQLRIQDRRAKGRDLPQPSADDLVTELDLLVRRLGAAALLGAAVTGDEPRELFEQNWEGDLLRRLRRVAFGHPDPRVRAAARGVKDRMWPLFVAATDLEVSPEHEESLRDPEQRTRIVADIDAAMVELKRATGTGVFRTLPQPDNEVRYRPSRLARMLAERTTL